MVRLSCAGCRARDRKIERLQREVRRLRRELDTLRRQQHRQTAPFRRRQTQQRPRRPGRRHGHPPAQRPTPSPERIDRVIAVPCRHCPDCRVELVDSRHGDSVPDRLAADHTHRHQLSIETGYCPCCHQYCQGRHPSKFPTPSAPPAIPSVRRPDHGCRTQTPTRRALSQDL